MYDSYEYMNKYGNKKGYKYILIFFVIVILLLLFFLFFKNRDLTITYKLITNNPINTDLTIYYNVEGKYFDKIMLPDGNISNSNNGTFTISENGTYKLKAYNSSNKLFEEEFVVNNIDKEIPMGTCEATLTNVDTKIVVDAKDNNGITKYEYIDDEKKLGVSLKNEYTNNGKTSTNIIVKIYDAAGNSNELKCNIINNAYFEPILPNTNENIVYKGETDTLKFYITSKSGYYLTRIWALDPYTQLNKAASPEYGTRMYTPRSLLEKTMVSNNLQDKMVIGFNTSGFYLKDTYDASSVTAYPAYDKTSVGTIVINNGQVIRNVYNHAIKQWYLTGITKDNKMVIFEDNKAKTADEITEKQKWAQTVIDSGIRNTFNFAGPVILNGKRLQSFSPSMPYTDNNSEIGLQLICQINDNNFALFTASKAKRNTAINVFESIGCQTATNLDGGGSIALLYKERNSSTFQGVIGGARQMPEVGYFTE